MRALREMARLMKLIRILTLFTFGVGRGSVLEYRHVRERKKEDGLHVFELTEMEQYLASAVFEDFEPAMRGSILNFVRT